jgi:colicin import membrane protein
MISPADAPAVSRPAPRFAAGALALGVHVLFVLLLVFGVSWQTRQPAPVMVDLWEAPPAATRSPKPLPQPAPKPAPKPQPAPKPVRPAPKPAATEPPPPKAPDIALEKKKAEAERLKKRQAAQAEEKARAEAAREKELAARKKRELLRQMEDEEAMRRRMADEEAASQARQAAQAEARAAADRRQTEMAGVVSQYRDLISAKVRGNTRLPADLTGNPEVRCLVKLLPTGEVQSVRVVQSSGNVAYDEAVMRAIEKSSPLPLPGDRDARAAFVPELSFVHRPK